MYDIATEVISIADACLGGLQGRSVLLIGPNKQRSIYVQLLWRARMQNIFTEDIPTHVPALLPHVQLVISMPSVFYDKDELVATPIPPTIATPSPALTAAIIAQGCEGRHTPLLIFDLDPSSSVEELAGLLPSVCLYTPDDLSRILVKPKTVEMKAS
jgi:hypothetical protein